MGIHPTKSAEGEVWATTPHHDISFLCDDIEATIAELTAKGVTFTDEVRDMGYGLVTTFLVPAAGPMQLYQPWYQPPFPRWGRARPAGSGGAGGGGEVPGRLFGVARGVDGVGRGAGAGAGARDGAG